MNSPNLQPHDLNGQATQDGSDVDKPHVSGPERPVQADSALPTIAGSGFDLSALRLPQDFTASVGEDTAAESIAVRRPRKDEFVRVHPAEEYRAALLVLELGDPPEIYLVDANLREELIDEPTVKPREIVTAITRNGEVFLWPLHLPGPDGKLHLWGRSALEACQRAQSEWVRIFADQQRKRYAFRLAKGEIREPTWPTESFDELVLSAFEGNIIRSLDHPVLKHLRGEA